MSDELRYPTEVDFEELEADQREEEGPLGWLRPQMESAYALLRGKGEGPAAMGPASLEPGPPAPAGVEAETKTGVMLAAPAAAAWRDILLEYRRRKAQAAPAAVGPVRAAAMAPGAPFVPGGRNWFPLGPSVVLEGQTIGNQPVGGRVSGVVMSAGAEVIYVATANGGVFRSDDGGNAWRSLMDGFDLDPTSFASASLVCGAIAISPDDADRVYVGSGEGDTHEMFSRRVTNALPAYRGVGPIRTDDGGVTWVPESSTPDLSGHAFFALAVDPNDAENVVGATSNGLYRRVVDAGGDVEWAQQREGVYPSVVVTREDGETRFYAAEWSKGVLTSSDGEDWQPAGKGFPSSGVGRIALGVQSAVNDRIYAFVARPGGRARGLFRLEGLQSTWEEVAGLPDVLPGGQGDYDLAIAVDPLDAEIVYLGGDRENFSPWPGSVWRCGVEVAPGGGLRVGESRSIGTHAHADVHVLVHTPGEPNELWCGCDGGVFLNRDPRGFGEFVGQNTGLSCLCTNFLGQHPTDPSILFVGLQDNGTARTAAGPVWRRVWGGDGGYCVVNWRDPNLVLVFANGRVLRSETGGEDQNAWSKVWQFSWVTMTLPIVTPPSDSANPAAADTVAVAAGDQVSISDDFAASWSGGVTLPFGAGSVFALAFASVDRLFIGTTVGRIYRAERNGGSWTLERLDDVPGGQLLVSGLVTDVAVDWADASGESIYVAFGGVGDPRRVWHFDGTRWRARGGSGSTGLLNVEHTSLAVDRTDPQNVYAGATIGVWHSDDGGGSWRPFQNGLPDAPVFDLQIHPAQRLLRVATHGRGVYEIALE